MTAFNSFLCAVYKLDQALGSGQATQLLCTVCESVRQYSQYHTLHHQLKSVAAPMGFEMMH